MTAVQNAARVRNGRGAGGDTIPARRGAGSLSLLIFAGSLAVFGHLASLHKISSYRVADFYGGYATAAMRVAAGHVPNSPFQGPGYPIALAFVWPMTGDLFSAGKWISVVSAALAGLLAFALFRELWGDVVGLGAQLLLLTNSVLATLAIEPLTDAPFLLLCLAALGVFLTSRLSPAWRASGGAALAAIAFLTRYNGVFLVVTFVLAIGPINVFAKTWAQRLRLLSLFGAVFLTVTAPWLYLNYRHRGSPLYNENYLNIAATFHGQDFNARANRDGLDKLRSRFHSFGDVIRYNPLRIARRYPVNLATNFRKSLGIRPTAICALVGLFLVLWSRKSKSVVVLLLSGVLFLLLMGLMHFEPRYYLFATALYGGFAAFAIRATAARLAERTSFTFTGREIASLAAVLALAALSAVDSGRRLKQLYADEPREILAACGYFRERAIVQAPVLSRKPHLPFVCGQKYVFLQNHDSPAALERWIRASGSAFLVIGSEEIRSRPALATWTDPDRTPEWLRLAWSDGSLSLFEIDLTTSPLATP